MYREIAESEIVREVNEKLEAKFAMLSGCTARGNPYVPGIMKEHQAFNIYALVRKCSPQILVETGVCNGFSTMVILAALERNGVGHLYSIDYPEFADGHGNGDFWEGKAGAVIPPGEESGWLVPTGLRGRWTLIIGKSQEKLRPLLHELGRIDLFLHDSEHSFENQLFEFRSAFEHLSDSGILLASDITWSDAFHVFWGEVQDKAIRHFMDHNLVIVRRKGAMNR